ncbi:MAG TPA: hypothetical protein RMG48_13460 [Myxococcales bacterium LLY-WYZ-16_1]|jgi:hypothetical protein|nr:hypothetical protein [Myxococcales bacterium LLY-WYZ-16_1]
MAPHTLVLPDWQHLDTVKRSPLPYVLWQVGQQPLLHHWLDHLVDRDVREVRFLCSDRPGEVRRALESAHLWPIRWTLEPLPHEARPPGADVVDHLPGFPQQTPPTDGWSLLEHWFGMRAQWFERAPQTYPHFERLSVGRFSQIHPTARIRPPVWFGDYVQVGPGCVVGPYVNLGRGAVLQGPSFVENAVITEHTVLAGHTELKDALLDGGRLFNLRHKAEVPRLDTLIADSLRTRNFEPSWSERAVAAALYAGFEVGARLRRERVPARTLRDFGGLELREGSEGPLWQRRRHWLREVARGKLRLWGVLPRTQEQLEALDPEWRRVLEQAPRGVFAYSDLHGSHRADTELEPVHAVFQATSAREAMADVFKQNVVRLLKTTPDE